MRSQLELLIDMVNILDLPETKFFKIERGYLIIPYYSILKRIFWCRSNIFFLSNYGVCSTYYLRFSFLYQVQVTKREGLRYVKWIFESIEETIEKTDLKQRVETMLIKCGCNK